MSHVTKLAQTSMVQRVAEIIGGGDVLPHHVERARSVIAIMREPTDLMKFVGAEFFGEDETADNARASKIVYGAMIDAALADC